MVDDFEKKNEENMEPEEVTEEGDDWTKPEEDFPADFPEKEALDEWLEGSGEEAPEEAEEVVEVEDTEEEEEPEGKGKSRKWLWITLIVIVLVVSVANSLWNKVESKLDEMGETVATQQEVIDNLKSELEAVKDTNETQLTETEKTLGTIKTSMNNMGEKVTTIGSKAEEAQTKASRHEEMLRKDLEMKKIELEKLSEIIAEQEAILNGTSK
jgi:F0F1-type ATP synthase membrane subunit b/b'